MKSATKPASSDEMTCRSPSCKFFCRQIDKLLHTPRAPAAKAPALWRFNARVYPSATPLRYFRRSPYDLTQEAIEQTWQSMQGKPEYADIEELTNNQNERFLFSTQHLTRRYAKAISDVDEWTD